MAYVQSNLEEFWGKNSHDSEDILGDITVIPIFSIKTRL
ncbi:hypothetical protein RINTHM_5370 [Richelia intracellularis HM01]|nr:hypothetical protein RINTHM_5370 [Richelia intracellularis HM01]